MLIVVRHGRTDANASGLLLGRRLDPGLDALGEQQAAALAAAVPRPARVISSPLQRTRQTAAAFGCPVEVDERWIELDYGALDAIAVVGAIVLVGEHKSTFSTVLGTIAVVAATSNIVGGFIITDRMLRMFKSSNPSK